MCLIKALSRVEKQIGTAMEPSEANDVLSHDSLSSMTARVNISLPRVPLQITIHIHTIYDTITIRAICYTPRHRPNIPVFLLL
jgi:hypothetical protein